MGCDICQMGTPVNYDKCQELAKKRREYIAPCGIHLTFGSNYTPKKPKKKKKRKH